LSRSEGRESATGKRALLKKFSILIPVIMLPLGAWLGYRTFRDKSGAEIVEAVTTIPSLSLALAFLCAAASYLCLSCFDTLAIRYLGRDLPYRKILLTSFVSLGIGHTVGVAALSSGTLRYRLYSGFGLSGADVGKIILFCAFTVGLGLMGLAGVILSLRPRLELGEVALSPLVVRGIGAACLLLVAAYILLAWRRQKPFRFRGHEFRLPDARFAAAQVGIGTLNFSFVAATLYHLLAGAASYGETVGAYVLANVSALVSHVPGGIGVLEYVVSSLVSEGNVIGALIAFRIVYFLIPLVLAIALLLTTELVRWRRK
jgi:glycosyltransferase 2 family protein